MTTLAIYTTKYHSTKAPRRAERLLNLIDSEKILAKQPVSPLCV